jgi:glycosyltransferase involved in cell wall biosynthesis
MPISRPLISVVIPHLNQMDALELCLESIDAQSLEHPFEIIVVDNGSTVVPDAVVARHPTARLLREPNPGPGLARNRGVQDANGSILCFIDADCRAHPDWLRNAVRTLESAPEATILGGDVRIWRDDESKFTALEAYESVFAYRFKLYIERHGYSGTGNLVLRRGDFDKVGPFVGILLAEDMEWGKRARAAGLKFRYVPEMIVYHPARQSIREAFVKWDRHIQHRVNEVRGESAWAVRWFARALAILISPAVDFSKVLVSDRIYGVSARFKAIMILIVIRGYRAWRMLTLLLLKKGVVWNRQRGFGLNDPQK